MLLTIGFATRDDVGAWYTLNDLLMHHGDVVHRDDVELLVVDNCREGMGYKQSLHANCKKLGVRLVYGGQEESSCLHKETMIRHAKGEYVMCCDSHVLFEPGAIRAMLEYHLERDAHNDLVSGPCYSAHGVLMGTNQMIYESEPYDVPENADVRHGCVWRGGSMGVWVVDERGLPADGPAYEVQQQGTGCFSFRREAWPGFHPSFKGHGGNETYLMERFRERGGRVMILPALQWVHCWMRAKPPYVVGWGDRVRNYLTGFAALGRQDLYDSAVEHLSSKCKRVVEQQKAQILRP